MRLFFPQSIVLPVVLLCAIPLLTRSVWAQSAIVQRTYRADAYIELFGINIVSRSDVGGALASIEQEASQLKASTRLVFISGSDPERAHGLNRMGYIEETISSSPAAANRSAYFGFMTANGEENLAEAKKALAHAQTGEVRFVAARGRIDKTQMRFTVQSLLLPSSVRWTDTRNVIDTVEKTLNRRGDDENKFTEQQPGTSESIGTFLHAVLTAIESPRSTSENYCMHNGRLFRLRTVKKPDEKTGAKLAEARLIASPLQAVLLSACLRNLKSGEETQFRLWFDKDSANRLPVRFEFQPKPYLRLVFQAEPAVSGCVTLKTPRFPPANHPRR